MSINPADLYAAQAAAVDAFGTAPADLSGRGVVTSVYDREFASGWVLLSELGRLGVTLPVEVWFREGELSSAQQALLSGLPLDLRLRRLEDPVEGWAIKPFAIWRSAFREVLWIDSDNPPIRDPAFLFDDPDYAAKGSLFWRDISGVDRAARWAPRSPVWRVFAVPYNDAEEFETGQLLIDKARCWPELGLTLHFNREAAIYHRFVHGDKDTFRLAWQNLDYKRRGELRRKNYLARPETVPYGFMPYGPFHMGQPNPWGKWGGGSVMVQRDREGRPLFNHRTINKFSLAGPDVLNADIENERFYHEALARLRGELGLPQTPEG